MELIAPAYYDDFRCLAAACPDSCCKEWEVDLDEVSAVYYRALPSALGDQLRSVLREDNDRTVMTITDRRCPMWRQDGLCEIQAQLGHEALCKTCREFPRLRHDYGSFAELGLELSCPEAARLIFTSPAQDLLRQTIPGGEAPEYEQEIMNILLASRQVALDFLNSCTSPLPDSLAVLLLYTHEVQSALDGGEYPSFDPESLLAEAKSYVCKADISNVFSFFSGLEVLTPRWRERLQLGAVNQTWQESLRPLAQYGIHRYWLQAVSDYDLVCRVKLILIACILVNAMGGDPVQTAQLFSKEIENNADNVEAILDGAYTYPAFTDVQLLCLFLG